MASNYPRVLLVETYLALRQTISEMNLHPRSRGPEALPAFWSEGFDLTLAC